MIPLKQRRPRGLTGAMSPKRRGNDNGEKVTVFRGRSQCVACDCWFNPYPGQMERLLCSDCAEAPIRQLQLPFENV